MSFILNFIIISTSFWFSYLINGCYSDKCIYPNYKNKVPGNDLLNELSSEIYEVKDDDGKYLYKIGFCKTPDYKAGNNVLLKYASVLQIQSDNQNVVVIGRFNDTDVKMGTNWASVEFGSGDHYPSHCNKTPRNAIIMISCNKLLKKGLLKILEENKDGSQYCYYLFELEHPKFCSKSNQSNQLSGWGIFFIVLISIVSVYLCIGVTIKKVFFGESGVEMIPNIRIWRAIGSGFADCTEYLCRPKTDSRYNRLYMNGNIGGSLTINDIDPDEDGDEDLVLP